MCHQKSLLFLNIKYHHAPIWKNMTYTKYLKYNKKRNVLHYNWLQLYSLKSGPLKLKGLQSVFTCFCAGRDFHTDRKNKLSTGYSTPPFNINTVPVYGPQWLITTDSIKVSAEHCIFILASTQSGIWDFPGNRSYWTCRATLGHLVLYTGTNCVLGGCQGVKCPISVPAI